MIKAPIPMDSDQIEFQTSSPMCKEAENVHGRASASKGTRSITPSVSEGSLSKKPPREHDIVCGRVKSCYLHPGNRMFREVIRAHQEEYKKQSCKNQKTRITERVIKAIEKLGCAFVKIDEETGEWVTCDPASIHEKVSHALRSVKDPQESLAKKMERAQLCTPTEAEDRLFAQVYGVQQEIFQLLCSQDTPEQPQGL
jgi:hypothetical protein